MYEYKTSVVGPLKRLRPGVRKVEEVGGDLASAYEAALNHYSRQGYRLHSVAHIEGALVLFVFEKEVLTYSFTTNPETYSTINNYCTCHNPHDAETPVSTEGLPPILPEMEGDSA